MRRIIFPIYVKLRNFVIINGTRGSYQVIEFLSLHFRSWSLMYNHNKSFTWMGDLNLISNVALHVLQYLKVIVYISYSKTFMNEICNLCNDTHKDNLDDILKLGLLYAASSLDTENKPLLISGFHRLFKCHHFLLLVIFLFISFLLFSFSATQTKSL